MPLLVINGLTLLPLAFAAVVFIGWLIVSGDRDVPLQWDETDALPAMGQALAGVKGHRYQYAVKPELEPGLDELRFYCDGVLLGAFLVPAGEAERCLLDVCSYLSRR